LEAVEEILEQEHEFGGVFVVNQMLVGLGRAGDAVAAGRGFAGSGARAGRFFGILTIGVDLRFCGHFG
jgi:hypothetical protein